MKVSIYNLANEEMMFYRKEIQKLKSDLIVLTSAYDSLRKQIDCMKGHHVWEMTTGYPHSYFVASEPYIACKHCCVEKDEFNKSKTQKKGK